ncbi:hypothetical protein LEP1GSC052_2268 [Leptospira kmetyi serovar Malaysia str. Bejo-Iso9]|nr:hypothetical protein LEP1GSC052_2268 [Leptospira kmetyi serovar Malaysia str. Bejo-Iso9]
MCDTTFDRIRFISNFISIGRLSLTLCGILRFLRSLFLKTYFRDRSYKKRILHSVG